MQPETNHQPFSPTESFFPTVAADADRSATQADFDTEKQTEGPARVLLQALKVHYLASTTSLVRLGISAKVLDQNLYIRSILSLTMDQVLAILGESEDCAEYVSAYANRICPLSIDGLPAESIRLTALLIFNSEKNIN